MFIAGHRILSEYCTGIIVGNWSSPVPRTPLMAIAPTIAQGTAVAALLLN
jgi:hypothetical protein